MTSDEVTAVCPVTGQPDFYTVRVDMGPRGRGIESKSLKLYLQSFRNMGIFAENLAALIRDDVVHCVEPLWCTVEVIQKSRGGVVLTAVATNGPGGTVGAVQGEA